MKVIGITGKSGSGKTTALEYMRGKGIEVIDGDRVSREIYRKGGAVYNETVKAFGSGILDKNGEIDRAALGKIVFSAPEKLEMLNKITHGPILCEIERLISASKCDIVAVEGGALIESGFWQRCDRRLAVLSDSCMPRIISRDNIDEALAKARLSAQKDDGFYTADADCVIYNNGTLSQFYEKIDAFLAEVRR